MTTKGHKLERRVSILEGQQRPESWADFLEAMADDDLFRLERIVAAISDDQGSLKPEALEELSDDDTAFLTEVAKTKEGNRCVT